MYKVTQTQNPHNSPFFSPENFREGGVQASGQKGDFKNSNPHNSPLCESL